MLYICVECKTVYPEFLLMKYIGNMRPYNPYARVGEQPNYNLCTIIISNNCQVIARNLTKIG